MNTKQEMINAIESMIKAYLLMENSSVEDIQQMVKFCNNRVIQEREKAKNLSLAELPMDTRVYGRVFRLLTSRSIKTLGDLCNLGVNGLLLTPGIGYQTVRDLDQELQKFGLRLNGADENPRLRSSR